MQPPKTTPLNTPGILGCSWALTVLTCCWLLAGILPAAAAPPVKSIAVSLDGRRTAEPMSPYIYAQFIEHLGRCIYGGIWAEMLEDRKFFYGVGEENSPWSKVGPAGAVTMATEDSFVGAQTPRITAKTGTGPSVGIAQGGLGLRQGTNYTGYIWLKAATGEPGVDMTLSWGDAPNQRQTMRIEHVRGGYAKYPLVFAAGGDSDNAKLEILLSGQGSCLVGTLSLMPADNIAGMRADTIALLKELDAPMYRWPGGNFVSGYDWRDGIGDRDRRPPRKNPAWQGVEHNDFGLDEFVAFCRTVGAEPLIVVNTGLGDAYSAAQEVEYANAGVDTTGGRWRAEGGHAEPYGVQWWGVGNEMYGGWQLGHMRLRHYILKHNQVVEYMRRVDPDIKLIAVGALGSRDPGDKGERRGWSEGMLQECSDSMTLISEHFYCGTKDDLVEHVRQIPENIKRKAEGHRALRQKLPVLADKDIRIAMDEWNYWHRPYVYGELGCIYHLRDALGIAAGLHEYSRNTDIISMAQYAQTVNVIGCIKTTKTAAGFATTGLVLKLYRHHFGTVPLKTDGDFAPVDVAAALTKDGAAMTVGVVNPQSTSCTLRLQLANLKLASAGTSWTIAGDDPMSYNEPGKPPRVVIDEQPVSFAGTLVVKPLSVTVIRLPVQ